jgi:MFS family permease
MSNEKALRWAINIAALVVLMDLSAVNIALPEMRSYFQFSVSLISMVLMISMLTATSSALIMGKISQLVSPKKILILGFAVFGLTTFFSGITRDFNLLMVLRFIQGFAEAALYVIGPALIKRYISAEKQASAYGQWMMSTGIGISVGPLIGGYLISLFSWPAVFFINIPLVILGLWFSIKLTLKTSKTVKENFDNIGAFLSFAFLASLIAGVNMGRLYGWSVAWVFLLVSLLLFLTFLYRQKKCTFPILQLSLFRLRNFWLASLGFFLFFVVNVGSRFLRPFYFEEGRGFETELSGLLMVISPAIMVLLAPFTEYFQRILGAKKVVLLGNFFLFISMLFFSLWDEQSSFLFIVFSMFLLGIGMGLFYPAATTIGMVCLPRESYGMGSAAIATSKSMGKLIGVLVFALLFTYFFQSLNPTFENVSFLNEIKAVQNVFRFAAGLAFVGFVFSFFFQDDIKQ